jgi:cytochrome c oxidase accessory protein FixG
MTPPLNSERVLSTLDADGKRHWIDPKLSRGRFLRRRRIVGYSLIALFVMLPFFVETHTLFRRTDGLVLMLLGITLALAVFLLTALFGRVWCGWACPQTVYLELVFRPIQRVVKRRAPRFALYAVLSFLLANVFLAYFVGVDRLRTWVIGSPLDHPGGFLLVVGVTALMLFDFAYFREQTCIVACPYGRLQSVLLDRESLIISYDAKRGEPRAQPRKKLPVVGDCVDCGACVRTCPTGIDIRDGLQMECVGCAQCIDACDAVMDKVRRPRGLIGYRSPGKLLRTRTIVYPILLAIAGGLFTWSIAARSETEISIGRVQGPSFVELPDGKISSAVRVKLDNTSDAKRRYTITIREPDAKLRSPQLQWEVKPNKSIEVQIYLDVPRASFVHGRRTAYLYIDESGGFHRVVKVTLLGPETKQ